MIQQIFREHQKEDLKSYLKSFDSKNIFLIRDDGSYEISGAKTFLKNTLNISPVLSFFDFAPNPQLIDLRKGISTFNQKKHDIIIAIGGGSVIDMAKLISVFAHQEEDIDAILDGTFKLNSKKTPLIAIPTTAGTGAEATEFAVLYRDKLKYSVLGETLLPDCVYLSHQFSLSAPVYLTASTGLDAFAQAIESAWSVNANDESLAYSYKATKIIWHNLEHACKGDIRAKQLMQEAAFLSGKAINITKTTAPHAISYGFSSYYNIPHGHAVAISLPFFFSFNANVKNDDCTDSRGAEHVKQRINRILELLDTNQNNIIQDLTLFFDKLNINIKISELIPNFNPELITKSVNFDRLSNNPRKVTKKDIERLLNT
ncbi:MAG: phosphonoacetaldehyde reductase [Bacteroidales bacterium]|nr:phosphonoacetaldehyde reductase [Bacteroidales bacterium]